jgi:predicted ATP-dependent endonuclease of OLD family
VGEVSMMGHGLQMWLQTMWFLTHAHESSTVILDEPDVYMHPDLQRRLIRFLRGRFAQVVLTTHSVEIMSEADPGEILIIDRRLRKSKFAGTLPAVQRVLEGIGSAQNVHLARLWSARKFLLVEGKDIKFLRHFQDRLFPDAVESFEAIPNMAIGGWGGWSYAVGGSMILQNAMGEDIKVYCVLDSDQHTEEEIEKRYETAKDKGVQLHIWRRKEIENYMLCANAIARVIAARYPAGSGGRTPTREEVHAKLDEIAQSLKDEALDDLSSAIMAQDRRAAGGTAIKRAREILKRQINSEGLLAVVSGKGMFSGLSMWTQQEFGTSISAAAVARAMKADEIPDEMARVIKAIELGKDFD